MKKQLSLAFSFSGVVLMTVELLTLAVRRMGARGQLIYLMPLCPGPALCSAFFLVLKCIAYRGGERKQDGGAGDLTNGVGGVLWYSGEELTLLCKRRKVI